MMVIRTADWIEREQRYLDELDGLKFLEEVEQKMDGRVCVLNWIGKFRRFFGKSLEVLMSDSGGLRCIRRTYHHGASEELENGILDRIKRADTPVFMLKSVLEMKRECQKSGV